MFPPLKSPGSLIEAGYPGRTGGTLCQGDAQRRRPDRGRRLRTTRRTTRWSTTRGFHALTPEALTELLEKRSSEEAGKAKSKPKAKAVEAKPAEKPETQTPETQSAQVIEEELEVGEARTTGGKRLKTEVSEREVQETVTLKRRTSTSSAAGSSAP